MIESKSIRQKPYEEQKHLHGIIHECNYNYVSTVSRDTFGFLGSQWTSNLKQNIKLWKKHKPLNSCIGLARNKATIGVGAGQSFNINRDVLAQVVNRDGVRNWEDRDFIVIASNHQFKPLIEFGIIPDFVILVDASDVVYRQLCEDIPDEAHNTVLITGLHCSPKVLNAWSKQGREILFYASPVPELCEAFRKELRKNPHHHKMELGGNTLNAAWMIAIVKLQSTIFMAVGNDLSYPTEKNLEKRRKKYYADGDYSSNAPKTGTGRDEAKVNKIWAGFTLSPKNIWTPNEKCKYDVKLDLVGTSGQLWVYKIWLETTLLGQLANPVSFRYYNCSEAGILGVMARELDEEKMNQPANWYMFDEVCRFYHTATLKDATDEFIKIKEIMRWHNVGTPFAAQYATGSEAN